MDILTGQQLLKKTGEVVNANEALKDKKPGNNLRKSREREQERLH